MRTGNSSARWAATAASTADLGDAKAAHTPSPVCLNNQPPCASIAARNASSWAASAARMPSASASHRRVEPSTSVNKNVTTPPGAAAAAADTSAESHNGRAPTSYIDGTEPGRRSPPFQRHRASCAAENNGSKWWLRCGAVPAMDQRWVRAMASLLMACGGFLFAVLWMDLIFDVQVLRHRKAPTELPEVVLASIAAYYHRATTTSRPMNRLI